MVGNGDAIHSGPDIVQDGCRTCQGRLGVDDPVFSIELRTKLLEVLRCPQAWGALNARGGGGASLGQRCAELPAKNRAQGPPRKEEAGIGLNHVYRQRQRPSRHDAVNMEMRSQGLIPGMCRTMVHPICPPRLRVQTARASDSPR